ncbi:MAG: hypothetical protein FWD26_08460 [Treponema sp.]|nr:hypothetical protein [Treponema sp.]
MYKRSDVQNQPYKRSDVHNNYIKPLRNGGLRRSAKAECPDGCAAGAMPSRKPLR